MIIWEQRKGDNRVEKRRRGGGERRSREDESDNQGESPTKRIERVHDSRTALNERIVGVESKKDVGNRL